MKITDWSKIQKPKIDVYVIPIFDWIDKIYA